MTFDEYLAQKNADKWRGPFQGEEFAKSLIPPDPARPPESYWSSLARWLVEVCIRETPSVATAIVEEHLAGTLKAGRASLDADLALLRGTPPYEDPAQSAAYYAGVAEGRRRRVVAGADISDANIRAEGREEMRAAVLALLEEMGRTTGKTLIAEAVYFAMKKIKALVLP